MNMFNNNVTKKLQTIILLCCFIFIFLNECYSQSTDKIHITLINSKVDELKSSFHLKNAAWSICVKKCKSDEYLFEYNSNIGLIPASVMKLVTTAAGLSILGPYFKYETKLQYSGYIDSTGILHGNLFIKGGGDPSFCSSFDKSTSRNVIFNKFYEALYKKGIKKINGSIVGDESIFNWNRIPGSWGWEDIGNYYGAGTCGLSYNNNQYKIFFDAGKTLNDAATLIKTEPEMRGITFINKVTTAGKYSGDKVIILCSPWSDTCWLTGSVPLGSKSFMVKGAMPDPAFLFAKDFNYFLIQKGININKYPTTSRIIEINNNIDTTARQNISSVFSPPFYLIINYINDKSDNTYAESVANICGLKNNTNTDTKKGTNAITDFWLSKNIDLQGFNMEDGSGLSRKNYITTRQLTSMLAYYVNEPTYKYFYNSLHVAGKHAVLRNMFTGTYAENNLRGKTGTMDRISSLAGYVTNKKGDLLAYSIIINNYNGKPKDARKIIEELLILIAGTE